MLRHKTQIDLKRKNQKPLEPIRKQWKITHCDVSEQHTKIAVWRQKRGLFQGIWIKALSE